MNIRKWMIVMIKYKWMYHVVALLVMTSVTFLVAWAMALPQTMIESLVVGVLVFYGLLSLLYLLRNHYLLTKHSDDQIAYVVLKSTWFKEDLYLIEKHGGNRVLVDLDRSPIRPLTPYEVPYLEFDHFELEGIGKILAIKYQG